MRLLALDCSTKATGCAIFDEDKNLIHYECITSASTDLFKRIHVMVDAINGLVNQYNIDQVVLEEVLPDHQKNQNTFKALMYLQGAFAMMMHDKNPKAAIEYMYPSSWRKDCGIKQGPGQKRESLKMQDIKFANEKYNLSLTSDDIADAICIGTAFLSRKNSFKVTAEGFNWG